MEKRNYTDVQALLPEIKTMLAEGKTQREVAEYYGFQDKQVVKRLLEREWRKERKLESGILPRPKGRPRKDAAPSGIVSEQAYEIERLLCPCPSPGQAGEGRSACGSNSTAAGTQFSHLRLSVDVAETAAYFLQSQNCAAGYGEASSSL